MGSESFVSGTVELDAAAAGRFRDLPSWEWFEGSHASEGELRLDLGGRWYRNIGRYLAVDLAQAQEAGEVSGEVVLHCTSDSGSWAVTAYRGRVRWHGEDECFHEPVVLRKSNVLKLELPPSLKKLTTLDGMAFLVADPEDQRFELAGRPAPFECSCEGWDHRNDRPLCQNARGRGGERVAMEREAR